MNLALIANQLLAQLPPISFESPVYVPLNPIQNYTADGWNLISGTGGISGSGEGFGGGQALKLPQGQNESWLRRSLTWDPQEKTAFIDFRIKPAAEPEGSLATFVTNGSQIAFQVPSASSTGQLWAFNGGDSSNGTSQWYLTPGSFPVAPSAGASSQWMRVTLRHDYDRDLWDLFIDGKLAAINLSFEGRGADLETLDFFGSRHGDTLLDDLSAQTTNMLFQDTDKDGLPDSWETANGSNPNLYDREAIDPVTGLSFVDKYLAALWPSGSTAANGFTGVGNVGTIPSLTIPSLHQPVGAVKGSFAVGADGAAGYSVPIDLPKGTGGMEPKISLGYSSGGGNGIAGLGWGINGFQKITRGPKTFAKEGSYDPVDFDPDDRFYLDGEKLVCVSGTYGAAGSEYRTEIDSFARITAVGAGPSSWKIETKAGLIVTLGETADSRQTVTQGTLSWGVNKVQDTVGNYYTVEYSRDSNAGQPFDFINDRIAAVHYTGNTAAGVSPYCHAYFDYETRPDVSRAYTAHAGYQISKRLSKIRVTTGAYTNHAYRFGYSTSYQTGRSLLTSVGKFAQDDDAKAIPATTFNYDGLQTGQPIWVGESRMIPSMSFSVYHSYEDYNEYTSVGGDDENISITNPGSIMIVENGYGVSLTGESARSLPLGGNVTIYSDSMLTFQARSENLSTIGVLGRGTTLYGGERMGVVRGSQASYRTFMDNTPTTDYPTASEWVTVTVPIGSGSTTTINKLSMICIDDLQHLDPLPNFSVRNIKIYRSSTQTANDVSAFTFSNGVEIPQLWYSDGRDRGVILFDIDQDGLSDLVDWRVTEYLTSTQPWPTAITEGDVFMNHGFGFTVNNFCRPPPSLPMSVRHTTDWPYKLNNKHQLLAQPVDVDGDGKLDLFAAVNLKGPSNLLNNEYSFFTWNGASWVLKSGWDLPFRIEGTSSEGHGGKRRTEHFQWVDLNHDGYQDLVIHMTAVGKLVDKTTGVTIAAASTSLALLNKGDLGPGWIRDDSYRLPERLFNAELTDLKDLGRKLVDIDGDQIQDVVEATKSGSTLTARTYFMNGSGAYRWNSTPGLANPPASQFDLPIPLAFSSGKNEDGAIMMDFNGDGLPDVMRSKEGSLATWINQGKRNSVTWAQEPTPVVAGAANTYHPELHLSYRRDGVTHSVGYEMGDLNGDGLTDILYSNEPNPGTPGPDNLTIVNTGNGWLQREAWKLPENHLICTGSEDRMAGRRKARLMDINSDGFPDLITGALTTEPKVWFNQCRPEVLKSVTDGFGSEIAAEYKRINDPTPVSAFGGRVYEKGTSTLPVGQIHMVDNRLVVSRYSEPDGMGGRRYKSQRYGDLRQDRDNETTLGFGWVEVLDEQTGQRNRTDVMREYPFAGSPLQVRTWANATADDLASSYPGVQPGLKLLTHEAYTYDELPAQVGIGGTIRRPVQTSAQKITSDINGDDEVTLGTVTNQSTTTQLLADFDSYGFVKKSTVITLDGTTVVTRSWFDHRVDPSRWHLGRLCYSVVTKSGAGKPVLRKSAGFCYSDTTGLLTKEITQPGCSLSITKSYGHDNFGNVNSTAVTASGTTRANTTQFDARGRFPVREENALGQGIGYSYDQDKALLLSTTDIGGLTSWLHYDSFGTLIRTDHPGGTQSAEITGFATNASLPSSVASHLGAHQIHYFKAVETSGSAPAVAYLDRMGRELVKVTTILRDASIGGSGRWAKVYGVTRYDARGRKVWVSEPFFEGGTPLATQFTYDNFDRLLLTQYPDEKVDEVLVQNSYLEGPVGLPSKGVSYASARRSGEETVFHRWEDEHARTIQTRDGSDQLTKFYHDHEGRILQVAINGVTLLTNVYDVMGNKTSVTEANSGTSTSDYNGFGEAESVTNANGQTTTSTYDALGRQTSVTKPEGTYFFYYDHASGNGAGKPWKTMGPSGYHEEIAYDSLGRPASTIKTQFGETFTTATTYDALGRVLTTTDAGGLVTLNQYDSFSFPVSITIAGGAPGASIVGAGTVLWEAGTYDASGRTLTQSLAQGVETNTTYFPGNGLVDAHRATQNGVVVQDKRYQWEGRGNLEWRKDQLSGKYEYFTYDEMNRLATSQVTSSGGSGPLKSYTYDHLGNLINKGTSPNWVYGPSGGTRPHAVVSAEIKGLSRSYSYNAAGYVVNDSKRIYSWASFGQLATLEYSGGPKLRTLGGAVVHDEGNIFASFDFDAAGNRARQTKERLLSAGSGLFSNETTLYLGAYERETHETNLGTSGPVVTRMVHRHSLGGVIYTRDENSSGTSVKLTTVLRDYLGSTDVLLVGTWGGGAFSSSATERQSFDAWGERRDATTLAPFRAADADAFRTSEHDYDRGYTGHEQLDDSGLIHMNGRIYDPELGRFLSPDPYVQTPDSSQNFNRYSYVLNNPLNKTDPTGFLFAAFHTYKKLNWAKNNWNKIGPYVMIAVAIVLTIFTAGIGSAAWGALYSASGMVLTPAVYSAGAAAVTGAMVGTVTGAVGAAMAGGDLGDILRGAAIGAISGAASGALHGVERWAGALADAGNYGGAGVHVVGHGVVGGLSNEAMGGKFGDGFLSAAAGAAAGWSPLNGAVRNTGVVGRTLTAGAVGGTVSAIGGGKFANGAYTAAFQHLLNMEFGRNLYGEVDEGQYVMKQYVGDSDPITPLVAGGGLFGGARMLGGKAGGGMLSRFFGKFFGVKTAKIAGNSLDDLVAAAQKAYPAKAGKIEMHHITPKYLGGAVDGPLVPLDAAYHQQITNAFRALAPYGGPKPSPEVLKLIMDTVYKKFPLPPGYTY